MEYQALYRQFRPEVFEDMVGQEHIVTALTNQIKNGRVGHAYLFCGTRGTGKTTTARILSRAVNCEHPNGADPCNQCDSCKSILNGSAIDVVEIDAASNTSVDNIRSIRDEVAYPPAMLKYKVYIIDEVHMLSTGAFNALLKTLEEPPEHVIFILATTEYHKVPATILSRCQRYDFKRISSQEIQDRLKYVCEQCGAKIDDDAAAVISYAADGSMRDGLAILDKCVSFGTDTVTGEIATKILGIVDDSALFDISQAIAQADLSRLMEEVEHAVKDGRDPILLTVYLIEHFRGLMIASLVADPAEVLQMEAQRAQRFKEHAAMFTTPQIITIVRSLSNLYKTQREAPNPKVMLEIGLASICMPPEQRRRAAAAPAPAMPQQQMRRQSFEPSLPMEAPPEEFIPDVPQSSPRAPEPVPTPPIQAASGSAPSGAGGILEKWVEIVDYVERDGKMMICSNLRLSFPREESDVLRVIFKKENAGNKMFVDKPDVLKYLEGVVEYITGVHKKIKVSVEDAEGSIPVPPVQGQGISKAMDLAKKFPGIVSIEDEEE